jgi:hypothetical protein
VSYPPGTRIALDHTSDPHTLLRPGDEGTVVRYDETQRRLDVTWDSGSRLAMLFDAGDRVRTLPAPPRWDHLGIEHIMIGDIGVFAGDWACYEHDGDTRYPTGFVGTLTAYDGTRSCHRCVSPPSSTATARGSRCSSRKGRTATPAAPCAARPATTSPTTKSPRWPATAWTPPPGAESADPRKAPARSTAGPANAPSGLPALPNPTLWPIRNRIPGNPPVSWTHWKRTVVGSLPRLTPAGPAGVGRP